MEQETQQAGQNEFLTTRLARAHAKIDQITSKLDQDNWFGDYVDKEEILRELCEILDVNPVKSVTASVSLTAYVTIEVPILEAEDYDLEQMVSNFISVDSSSSELDISDWHVESVNEE